MWNANSLIQVWALLSVSISYDNRHYTMSVSSIWIVLIQQLLLKGNCMENKVLYHAVQEVKNKNK